MTSENESILNNIDERHLNVFVGIFFMNKIYGEKKTSINQLISRRNMHKKSIWMYSMCVCVLITGIVVR